MRRSDEQYPMRRPSGQGLMRSDLNEDPFGFSGSPWQMMRRMQEDMDHLFGRFFGGRTDLPSVGIGSGGGTQWAPSMDVSSTDKEICLEADLPGVNKDDIDVTVHDHHLHLKAEMRQEQKEGDGERQFHRRERRYGYFERVIPLPENVDEQHIACDFKNGVLTVHVPRTKQGQAEARKIPIKDPEAIPSQTAGGRSRSRAELDMTEDVDEHADTVMAGAKGGEKRSTTRKKS
jgi:HSP20 family protein